MKKEEAEGYIREIRGASCGKEAREPIARVLEEIGRKLDEEGGEITNEVRDARKGSNTIASRLDGLVTVFDTSGLFLRLGWLKDILEDRQKEEEQDV